MLPNNDRSFKILTSNKQPTPKKWFILIIVDLVLFGIWFLFLTQQAFATSSLVKEVFIEIIGFVLGAALIVFLLAFLVDTVRSKFK